MKTCLQYKHLRVINTAVTLIRIIKGFSIGILPKIEKHEFVCGSS